MQNNRFNSSSSQNKSPRKKRKKSQLNFYLICGGVVFSALVGIFLLSSSLNTGDDDLIESESSSNSSENSASSEDSSASSSSDAVEAISPTPAPTAEPVTVQKITSLEEIDLSTDGVDFSLTNFDLSTEFSDVILPESEDAGAEYLSDIVFVGESTTYGLYHYEVLPEGRNTVHVWTPTSGTLMLTNANKDIGKVNVYNPNSGAYEDLLIKDAAAIYQPEYMVITLGLNGVGFYIDDDPSYYIGEYVTLLNSIMEVSPNTKLMVQSVFPVANTYAYIDSISNERLNKANYLFAKMCRAMGVRFIYSAPIFMDETGNMSQTMHNGDGLHLNANALNMELDYIKKHKYQ